MCFKMSISARFGGKVIIKLNVNPLKAFIKNSSSLLVQIHLRLDCSTDWHKNICGSEKVSKDWHLILSSIRVHDVNSEGRYNFWT